MSGPIVNPLIEPVKTGQEFWEARSQAAPFSSGYTDPSVERLEWDAIRGVIETHLPNLEDISVLEIGCHVGYSTRKLYELLLPSRYEALDVSPGSVQMARHYSEVHGFDEVDFFTASATEIPRNDASYDLLFSIRCIQNIQSGKGQVQAFSEMSRLLKPGGVAILVENWVEELSCLNRLRNAAGLDPIAQPQHTHFLGREELADQIDTDFERVQEDFFASAYYFGTRFAKWLNPNECATDLESPHNLFYRDLEQGGFRLALGPALTVLRKKRQWGAQMKGPEFFPDSSRGEEERRALAEAIMHGESVSSSYLNFGFDYFDNPDHGVGYGGYHYDGRHAEVAKRMVEHYGLKPGDRVLEIGCAKGFLLVEFIKLGMKVTGLDASQYAVNNSHPDARPFIRNGLAKSIPVPDGHFQLVIGKEVLPHVPKADLERTVCECMRVSDGRLFFEIQCGTTDKELEYMAAWDKTHQVCQTPDWWEAMFGRIGYPGDVHYKVLIPEGEAV